MSITYEEIKEQARQAAEELVNAARLKKGNIFVVGCSSSEVMGQRIGKGSDINAAEAIYEGIMSVLEPKGIYLAAQCCEHLNRAVIVEKEALLPGTEIVNVVPHPHAGGSFATTMYHRAKEPRRTGCFPCGKRYLRKTDQRIYREAVGKKLSGASGLYHQETAGASDL